MYGQPISALTYIFLEEKEPFEETDEERENLRHPHNRLGVYMEWDLMKASDYPMPAAWGFRDEDRREDGDHDWYISSTGWRSLCGRVHTEEQLSTTHGFTANPCATCYDRRQNDILAWWDTHGQTGE